MTDENHADIHALYDRLGETEKNIAVLQTSFKMLCRDITSQKKLIKENGDLARNLSTQISTMTRTLTGFMIAIGFAVTVATFFIRTLP